MREVDADAVDLVLSHVPLVRSGLEVHEPRGDDLGVTSGWGRGVGSLALECRRRAADDDGSGCDEGGADEGLAGADSVGHGG